jgi:hypothetical protein
VRDNRNFHGNPFGHGSRPTNGVHAEGMNTRPAPFDEIEEPIDLVAVQADDELINALAAGMSVSAPGLGGFYDADDKVAAILAAWKADVDAEPIPELVDVDTAVSTVVAGRPPSRRARHLAPVAAAAAFIVLAIGGVSVGSYSAGPDDALWGVSKVLYSERAESVEAKVRVEERIAKAKDALVAGDPVVAVQELRQAQADLAVVRPEEGLTELAEVQDFLVAKAAETPPGKPTDPGTPLATQPSRPVPAGAAVEPGPAEQPQPDSEVPVSGTPTPGEPAPEGSAGATDPRVLQAPQEPSTAPGSTDPTSDVPPSGAGTQEPTGVGSSTATPEGSPGTTAPGQSMGQTPNAEGGGETTASGSNTATTS